MRNNDVVECRERVRLFDELHEAEQEVSLAKGRPAGTAFDRLLAMADALLNRARAQDAYKKHVQEHACE